MGPRSGPPWRDGGACGLRVREGHVPGAGGPQTGLSGRSARRPGFAGQPEQGDPAAGAPPLGTRDTAPRQEPGPAHTHASASEASGLPFHPRDPVGDRRARLAQDSPTQSGCRWGGPPVSRGAATPCGATPAPRDFQGAEARACRPGLQTRRRVRTCTQTPEPEEQSQPGNPLSERPLAARAKGPSPEICGESRSPQGDAPGEAGPASLQ